MSEQLVNVGLKRSISVPSSALPSESMVQRWLELANSAPSADNMQPWAVTVLSTPGRVVATIGINRKTLSKPSEIDSNFTTSFIALGAYAQNLVLAAEGDGFSLERIAVGNSTEGQETDGTTVFNISLAQSLRAASYSGDVSAPAMLKRVTNRNPYEKKELSAAHVTMLREIETELHGSQVSFQSRIETKSLVGVLAKLDVLRYVNRRLFHDFIGKMRFLSQAAQTRDGLAGETLGVPVPARVSLALLKKFSFLWPINFLGVQFVSVWMGVNRLFAKSSGAVLIQGKDCSPLGWFNLGFDVQRVWLRLAAAGISAQPFCTTLLIYRAQLEENRKLNNLNPTFSNSRREKILKLNLRLKVESGVDATRPLFILRVGYTSGASARPVRSLRRALEV